MGDFFASPQQRASESMYKNAVTGKPIGQYLLQNQFGQAKRGVGLDVSQQIGSIAGDTQAQMASQGMNPASGAVSSLIDKATAPIIGQGEKTIASLSAAEYSAMIQNLFQQLQTGMAGMSKNSPFADVLAGLTTAAHVGAGVATAGASLGWWGPTAKTDKPTAEIPQGQPWWGEGH